LVEVIFLEAFVMANPRTHVKGQLLISNPTAAALEFLLARMIADPSEYPPATMAPLIMDQVGKDVCAQIGPGLEAETEEGTIAVKLKWELWL
jgi:hypothetical protein